MKTLIVTKTAAGKIRIRDLSGAWDDKVIHLPGIEEVYQEIIVENLCDAAPNLSLSVKNATASKLELRLWATLGAILQLAAMAFPGVATYYWHWEKGGAPVVSYGYPCFLIGTSFVLVGVMVCGHIIEGITTERNFEPSRWDQDDPERDEVTHIVRLQRSCTVGDQLFPSVAIFNSADDLILRTSRLGEDIHREYDYSSTAVAATAVSITGFILQFIGLRALHWSATIAQLGVTSLMTGVRAYVRRALASNPVCKWVPNGEEAACLTLQLLSRGGVAPIVGGGFPTRQRGDAWDMSMATWEVPTLRGAVESFHVGSSSEEHQDFYCWARDKTTLRLSSEDHDALEESEAVDLHASIQRLMPHRDRVADVADRLTSSIERLAAKFASAPTTSLLWIEGGDAAPFDVPPYRWYLPARVRAAMDRDSAPACKVARFTLEHSPSAAGAVSRHWKLVDPRRLHSALALWVWTLDNPHTGLAEEKIMTETRFFRVVAFDQGPDIRTRECFPLQGWLGKHLQPIKTIQGGLVSRQYEMSHCAYGRGKLPIFGGFFSAQSW